jgi:hypothetical protein
MALSWSEVEPPSPGGLTLKDFYDLGSGVLVGVGGTGLAYRSTDGGATWASVTLAENNAMTGLAYNGSTVVVAVSSNGVNRIQKSTDGGVNWTAIAAPVVAGWQSVVWDPTNSKFIAVASSGAGNRTMSSSDGTTWTAHAAAAAKTWNWVAASTTVVVAAASGTSVQQIMTSTDGGVNWTLQTHTSWNVGLGVVSQGHSGLAWSAAVGVFAIGAQTGGTNYGIITSPDGVTWTFRTIPNDTTQRVVSIVAAPSQSAFFATTVRVAGVNVILTATAAATWTALDPTIYRDWTASGWSDSAGTFVSWDTSGHAPQTILLGSSVSLAGLSPAYGPKAGGTVVTITGSGLGSVSAVTFDGTAAIDVVPAADGLSVTCIAPAHTVGVVDVVITGAGTLAAAYTYVSVDKVTPKVGTATGGVDVTITGYGFGFATGAVLFDTKAATNVVIVSNTSITCTTPAHRTGTVDVTVSGVGVGLELYTYRIEFVAAGTPVSPLPPLPVFSKTADVNLVASQITRWLAVAKDRIETPPTLTMEQVIGEIGIDQIPDDVPWTKIDKTGSSLDDLEIKNAGDLSIGILRTARMPAFTGDVTTTQGAVATTITADAVTYAKMQNISAASKLLGRGSAAGAGDPQELTVGSGLKIVGTTLSGGLVLLETQSVAAAATLDAVAWYSSAYDEYLVELVNLIPATNLVNILLRVSTDAGVSYDSGANYQWAGFRSSKAASASAGATATTSIGLDASGTQSNSATTGGLCGSFRLFNPGSTSLHKRIKGEISINDATASPDITVMLAGNYVSTTAVNGLRVLASSGNLTGTMRIYGIAK